MKKAKLIEMYLDWFNNFLSLQRFAEYYDIGQPEAQPVIDQGRAYH